MQSTDFGVQELCDLYNLLFWAFVTWLRMERIIYWLNILFRSPTGQLDRSKYKSVEEFFTELMKYFICDTCIEWILLSTSGCLIYLRNQSGALKVLSLLTVLLKPPSKLGYYDQHSLTHCRLSMPLGARETLKQVSDGVIYPSVSPMYCL